jgi:diguanylate cyclase (GGDEF)-like protein
LQGQPRQDLELLARAAHLQAIFKHALIVLLANSSAGATLAVGLWSVVPHPLLSGWLAAVVIFNLGRWLTGRRLARMPLDEVEVTKQEALLLGSTLISALLWTVAAVMFYVPGEPAYSLFLALILVAITAASTVLLSFHRFAYPVFALPIILPLAIQLASDDGASHAAVAAVIPLYYSLLFILSRQIYRFTHESIVTSLTRECDALTDHLTGIPNRRAFDEFLQKQWLGAVRTRSPLTLILSDIDDFKAYNDRHGHAVGDDILRSVARLLMTVARRRTDLVARLGGDEFALIAPGTDRLGADRVVERIRLHHRGLAQDATAGGPSPDITFGACSLIPTAADSPLALFEQADAALYEAKRAKMGSRAALPPDDAAATLPIFSP